MERKIEGLPERDRYAGVYQVLKLIPSRSEKYAAEQCGSGFAGTTATYAPVRDRNCDYYTRQMVASWETAGMLIADLEPV